MKTSPFLTISQKANLIQNNIKNKKQQKIHILRDLCYSLFLELITSKAINDYFFDHSSVALQKFIPTICPCRNKS